MAFNKDTGAEAGKKSKRGTNNQLKEIREVYHDILNNNTNNIQGWFDKIAEENPAKALELMLKLGSYVIPKPKTIEITAPQEDITVIRPADYSKWSDEDLTEIIELHEKEEAIKKKYSNLETNENETPNTFIIQPASDRNNDK